MPRNLLLVPIVFSLLGCQVSTVMQSVPSGYGPACYVGNDVLSDLLKQQQRYLGSSSSARRQQLAQAVKSNDKALEALLLTSPKASAKQFAQGSKLLASLPLYPEADCTADRYLRLHLSQLELRQQQEREIQQLDNQLQQQHAQIAELKQKIEALTDLEQEITRQRKDL